MKRFYQCNEIHDHCHEILPMKKLARFAVTKKMENVDLKTKTSCSDVEIQAWA